MNDLKRYDNYKKKYRMSLESIFKMMDEYAYSEKEKAYSYFINKYNLPNPYSFYKARDLAIICHIVDEKTCFRIFTFNVNR